MPQVQVLNRDAGQQQPNFADQLQKQQEMMANLLQKKQMLELYVKDLEFRKKTAADAAETSRRRLQLEEGKARLNDLKWVVEQDDPQAARDLILKANGPLWGDLMKQKEFQELMKKIDPSLNVQLKMKVMDDMKVGERASQASQLQHGGLAGRSDQFMPRTGGAQMDPFGTGEQQQFVAPGADVYTKTPRYNTAMGPNGMTASPMTPPEEMIASSYDAAKRPDGTVDWSKVPPESRKQMGAYIPESDPFTGALQQNTPYQGSQSAALVGRKPTYAEDYVRPQAVEQEDWDQMDEEDKAVITKTYQNEFTGATGEPALPPPDDGAAPPALQAAEQESPQNARARAAYTTAMVRKITEEISKKVPGLVNLPFRQKQQLIMEVINLASSIAGGVHGEATGKDSPISAPFTDKQIKEAVGISPALRRLKSLSGITPSVFDLGGSYPKIPGFGPISEANQ